MEALDGVTSAPIARPDEEQSEVVASAETKHSSKRRTREDRSLGYRSRAPQRRLPLYRFERGVPISLCFIDMLIFGSPSLVARPVHAARWWLRQSNAIKVRLADGK